MERRLENFNEIIEIFIHLLVFVVLFFSLIIIILGKYSLFQLSLIVKYKTKLKSWVC
jgi:hypothetical protein